MAGPRKSHASDMPLRLGRSALREHVRPATRFEVVMRSQLSIRATERRRPADLIGHRETRSGGPRSVGAATPVWRGQGSLPEPLGRSRG